VFAILEIQAGPGPELRDYRSMITQTAMPHANTLRNRLLNTFHSDAPVKWGSVTTLLSEKPRTWGQAKNGILPMSSAPQPHDVFLGRVAEVGRHRRIEVAGGRKSRFYEGDIVGAAFGHRYATRQYEGTVPDVLPLFDMLSQAGVCGQVVSASEKMRDPTLIEPIGYLADQNGEVLNLRSLAPPVAKMTRRIPTIVVAGSSMDSGKTRTVSSIVHGLSTAGHRVHAGKVTGTACLKDINEYRDAGAQSVVDFSEFGFASTFRSSSEDLRDLTHNVVANLSANSPDFLVLEIADGLIQHETQVVIDYLHSNQLCDFFCLAVHDAMAAPYGIQLLDERWGIRPTLISGMVTCSPLSTAEVGRLVDATVMTPEDLCQPDIATVFKTSSHAIPRELQSVASG